jgi:hypothetical protein
MAIIENTSTEIGDVIVIKSEIFNEGISTLESFVDITEDETGTRFFDRRFRYSIDGGVNFSDWFELSFVNINGLEVDGSISNSFVIEYNYQRAGTDATGTIAFNSVALTGAVRPSAFGKIFKEFQQLYPTGVAFQTPTDSNRRLEQLAIAKGENRVHEDVIGLLNRILPDNDDFTIEDALRWEKFLAIPTGIGTTLEDRKLAILRKYQYPYTQKARGNALWVERELQLAGFNVFVHENRFLDPQTGNYFTKTHQEVVGILGNAVHSPVIQHGTIQHGTTSEQKVVNSINGAEDNTFDINGNYERTFFVGGAVLGNFAGVPASREIEFRKLILELKPTQTVGFLLINYV